MSKYKIYREVREFQNGIKEYRTYARVGKWWSGYYYLVPATIGYVLWHGYKENISFKPYPFEDIENFKEDVEIYIQNQKDSEVKSFKVEVIG